MADVRYAIKRQGLYLQGTEPNPNYCSPAKAPTMGTRHSYSEYRTVWGDDKKTFERLTLANYIRILTEEYRWGDRKPADFKIECEVK